MSEISRRQTRSQTALSRGHTPEASLARDEPQAPASVQSKASTRRSAAIKPLLKTETSTTYGSKGQKTLAQQLAAQEAMNKAVTIIETEVTGAVEAGPSRRLATVNEDGAEDIIGSEHASVIDRGNVSGEKKDLSALELTGLPKSFHREIVDESDSDRPPRDDPSDSHGPNIQKHSLLARLRAWLIMYSPILGFLFLLLVAVIAFMLVAMWVGWRPLDGSLPPGEYNKSFVRREFAKMTHKLEGQGLQLMEHFNNRDRQMWELFDNRDRLIQERSDSRDLEIRERMESRDREIWDRLDSRDREIQERMEGQDRHLEQHNDELFQKRNMAVHALLQEEHRVLEQVKRDLETADLKFRESPGESRINWFSRGLAAVSTRFSSPTLANPLTFKEKLVSFRLELGQLPMWQTEKPTFEDPMSIFSPWETFGQKWCAPSRRGKLQAVVRLAYSIAPTDIQIEHMKKSQMPDVEIGTAPKEVELWIQILDPKVRQMVIDNIEQLYPSITTKPASQRGKTIDSKLALDKTWVPVGRWDYDIHRLNNKQGFLIPFNLEHLGVKTRAVAIRVNSNWGSMDSTCLYRVRLYGAYMESPTEFTDLELIPDQDKLDKENSMKKKGRGPFQAWRRWYSRHP